MEYGHKNKDGSADLGLIGLGTMGCNLALNLTEHGYSVAVHDHQPSAIQKCLKASDHKNIVGCANLAQMIHVLRKPRVIFLLLPAGDAVDMQIEALMPLLDRNDIVIDGGNTYYRDTERRILHLADAGIAFLGVGISGGAKGARLGASIMAGGASEAYAHVVGILRDIAATINGEHCVAHVGPGGSGHFVKMMHNGIEYADMQLIAEAYYLLRYLLDFSYPEMRSVFSQWNDGVLRSYLIEITANILDKIDQETGKPMLEIILDHAEQKGTGRWATDAALEYGVAAPTIAEAVHARYISTIGKERTAAALKYSNRTAKFLSKDKASFVNALGKAIYAARICVYAQGLTVLASASRQQGWNIDIQTIIRVWRAGCIIRGDLLNNIIDAFARSPDLPNLLADPELGTIVADAVPAWGEMMTTAMQHGMPLPALSSALNYFYAYHRAYLWTNLIQAQRDYFGAHGYERTDRPGKNHFNWTELLS